jgi:hypothetical protein
VRRATCALLGGAALAATIAFAAPAHAVDRRTEATAKDALRRASNDYLATDYATGAARLQKALRACGLTKCSAGTRALLLRDMGTMLFRNGDVGAARKAWLDALKLQSDVALNPDYDTPDLHAAFDEAKNDASTPPAEGGAPQPSGDFAHTPAAEQKAGTALPVYVEYPGSSSVARVIVKYKGAGASEWSRVQLKRVGSGWGGDIPCGDVIRGTMRYWIQGFDEGNDPIASSGDPKHPYTVPIRDEITSGPPHLPGKAAPRGCTEGEAGGGEAAACTPGTPGCPAAAQRTEDEEEEATPHEVAPHEGGAYARFWFGVSGEFPEFLQVPAGDDVCKLTSSAVPANSANMYCTNPNGTDFPSRATPEQNAHLSQPGDAGHVDGGFRLGDVRVMATFDYALSASFLLGARLGFVVNSYPGQAAVTNGKAFGSKAYAEARATYLFGHEPLAHAGFAPMLFLGLGASEFDGHTTTVVTLDNVAGQQPVNAWITDGPFFATLGAGFRYAFSPRAGFTAAMRANLAVGGNGVLPTYGPEFGVAYGF